MKNSKTFCIIFLTLFSIIFCSCKKDANAPAPSNNTASGTQSGNYGVFVSRKQAIISNTLVSSFSNFSTAYISGSPLINNNPLVGSLLNIGIVSLNGTTFQKNAYSVQNMYRDSTSLTYNTPHIWDVTGYGAVTSFSYSNTTPYPIYTGYNAIQDSFNISGNIAIPLNNYSGSDEIETYFVTTSNPVTNTTIQNIMGSPTTLNFTASDLNIIGANSDVTLVINFYKNNTQTINGKSYNFRTGYSLMKSNIKFK